MFILQALIAVQKTIKVDVEVEIDLQPLLNVGKNFEKLLPAIDNAMTRLGLTVQPGPSFLIVVIIDRHFHATSLYDQC